MGKMNSKIEVIGAKHSDIIDYTTKYSPEISNILIAISNPEPEKLFIDINAGNVYSEYTDGTKKEIAHSDKVNLLLESIKMIDSFPRKYIDINDSSIAVILGAGKGTRMKSPDKQKVVFSVLNKTATSRAVEIYQKHGLRQQVVVIGMHGEQVIEDLSKKYPGVTYVWQAERLGTGHAAKQAVYLLEGQGYKGDILIVAGDKVIDPKIIDKFSREFKTSDADLALMVAPKWRWPNSGRIVHRKDGNVGYIIEKADIQRRIFLNKLLENKKSQPSFLNSEFLKLVRKHGVEERKLKKILGEKILTKLNSEENTGYDELKTLISDNDLFFFLEDDGIKVKLTGEEIEERANKVNISVYLFKAESFYYSVKNIERANVQEEEYLTDVVEILSREKNSDGTDKYKILSVEVDDTEQVLAFNTIDELEKISEYLNEKAIELLHRHGITIIGDKKNCLVDDLYSIEKIGEKTVLNSPVLIDLGPDPEMKIGKNCNISGEIVECSIGDNCRIEKSKLRNLVIGDNVTIKNTVLQPDKKQTIKPGTKIVRAERMLDQN